MRRFNEIPNWSPGYLNTCPHHVVILVSCLECGVKSEFDRNTAPSNARHALIDEIEPRLKCSSCGAKKAKMLFGHWGEG